MTKKEKTKKIRKIRWSKMDSPVEEPVISPNWSDLPNELKVECIKGMPFDMRTKLKLTSKTENALVESIKSKYPFDYVCLHSYFKTNRWNESGVLSFTAKSDKFGTEFRKRCDQMSVGWEPVFENSKINKLSIKTFGEDPSWRTKTLLQSDVKFDVSTIEIALRENKRFDIEMLKKCDCASLKKIVVREIDRYSAASARFKAFLELPQVSSAQSIQFDRNVRFCREVMQAVARMMVAHWGKSDHPAGKEMTFVNGSDVYEHLLEKLPAPLVVRIPNQRLFLIRTANKDKFIWCWPSARRGNLNMLIGEKSSASFPVPDFAAIEKRKEEEQKAERDRIERQKAIDARNRRDDPRRLEIDFVFSSIYQSLRL